MTQLPNDETIVLHKLRQNLIEEINQLHDELCKRQDQLSSIDRMLGGESVTFWDHPEPNNKIKKISTLKLVRRIVKDAANQGKTWSVQELTNELNRRALIEDLMKNSNDGISQIIDRINRMSLAEIETELHKRAPKKIKKMRSVSAILGSTNNRDFLMTFCNMWKYKNKWYFQAKSNHGIIQKIA